MDTTKEIIVVGAGLFGATCARLLFDKGYDVTIYEQREHIGGNCYDKKQGGIMVHKHGPHIFHTNNEKVWKFVTQYTKFNNYTHKVLSHVGGQYISFPPNKMTYQQLGASSKQVIYDKMFDGYTRKQWGAQSEAGRQEAVARIPWRTTFDDRMFTDKYQGIPVDGYTAMISNIIGDIPVKFERFQDVDAYSPKTIIYSGSLDELFDYKYGELGYRSLRFEDRKITGDFQGCAVVNYPDYAIPFTRITEHRHFYYNPAAPTSESIVTYEYPEQFVPGTNERYYPMPEYYQRIRYQKYLDMKPDNLIVGGRLGSYRYIDMDETIERAMKVCEVIP
jgi:UDP-galactopyranose mutase